MSEASSTPNMKDNYAPRKINGEWTQQSDLEIEMNKQLLRYKLELLPKFGNNWNAHDLLTIKRQSISRILYYDELYRKIVGVPGVICEFGVQWGATLSQLISLRGIHEPYNHSRKIYGFDTFSGFHSIDHNDGEYNTEGDYSVDSAHFEILHEILKLHEMNAPLPHLKKWDLIKGDASLTVGPWLSENPHVVISMAIFDMDVYKPTRDVLEVILPRLTRGSLLVFDELNVELFPGETIAVQEVLGLNNLRLRHNPNQPLCAYAVFGE